MEQTLKDIALALIGIGKELEGIREIAYDLLEDAKKIAADENKPPETVVVDDEE
jgi:hypothetical protein